MSNTNQIVNKIVNTLKDYKNDLHKEIAVMECAVPSDKFIFGAGLEKEQQERLVGIRFQFERLKEKILMHMEHAEELAFRVKEVEDVIRLSGQEVAELIEVEPSTLSEAVKQGYRCNGYQPGNWAVRYDDEKDDRVKEYEVPIEVYHEIIQQRI